MERQFYHFAGSYNYPRVSDEPRDIAYLDFPESPVPNFVILREKSLTVADLTDTLTRLDLEITNPYSVEVVPYYPKLPNVHKFAIRLLSDDGMSMYAGDISTSPPFTFSNLKALETETIALRSVGQFFIESDETYNIFGHVHLQELNLVIFVSEVTKTHLDGTKSYHVSIFAAGSTMNFTSWEDFMNDVTDLGNLYHSTWIWIGNSYSESLVNPCFKVLAIQKRIYFAVSNHEGGLKQNFITSFSTEKTLPGRVRFDRLVVKT